MQGRKEEAGPLWLEKYYERWWAQVISLADIGWSGMDFDLMMQPDGWLTRGLQNITRETRHRVGSYSLDCASVVLPLYPQFFPQLYFAVQDNGAGD
jgi:hypothetical protein